MKALRSRPDPTAPVADGVERTYPFVGRRAAHVVLMFVVVALPFVLLAFAFVTPWARFGWHELVIMVVGQIIASGGISLGYHRMTAHGAFRARAPVKAVLLATAGMALQGGPATWAATHRRHHAVSDKPGDPHSPLEGFWHAHFGWLPKGRLVTRGPAFERLMADPMIRFFERTQLLWFVLSIGLPAVAAWALWGPAAFLPGLIWGGFVRAAFVHHVTWSVNSLGHVVGTRPHASPDRARNNGILALFSFGEGWHNNHHAFPQSAWLGHRWYQLDFGRYVIALLEKTRLVTDVVRPGRRTGPTAPA